MNPHYTLAPTLPLAIPIAPMIQSNSQHLNPPTGMQTHYALFRLHHHQHRHQHHHQISRRPHPYNSHTRQTRRRTAQCQGQAARNQRPLRSEAILDRVSCSNAHSRQLTHFLMTKTAQRKLRKAQRTTLRATRNAQQAAQRATPAPRAAPRAAPAITNPFDLTPADIQRVAIAQRAAQQAAQQAAQRRGQQRANAIAPNQDYSETIRHADPVRHAPPARHPGRCGPVAPSILYFEAWRAWILANNAQYKPRHYLGISPVWSLRD